MEYRRRRRGVGAGGRVESGSCTVKVEPRPSSVESMMRPPCSRTMPWLIERPSPVPSPSGLVVKKGSNTWAASASDMPGPSSITSTATPSSQRRARTTHAPGPPGAGDRLRGVVDQVDEDLLDLVGVDVGHRQIGLDLDLGLDAVRHELVAEQHEGGVEQGPERGGAALMLLLPREAQQVLDDVRRALGLLPDDRERLAQGRRHVGHLAQEIGEADDRGERVVEVVRDAGDELADGGHFFRLDELVLQSPPLRLIIEQEHQGGSVGAGNRHGGNRIGPLAGAELHLAARSLLLQGPLQLGGPLGGHEGLPGAADQARGRRVHQIGKGTVGPADPSAAVHDAEGGGDGVDHLLPGAAAVVVQVYQPGALERDAGLGDEALEQPERGRAVAPALAPDRHRAGYPPAGDERCEQPEPAASSGGGRSPSRDQRVEAVGEDERPAPLDRAGAEDDGRGGRRARRARSRARRRPGGRG